MDINEKLQVGECDKPQFQCRADGLASVGRVQLPENVVKVSLDRRRREAELARKSLCGQALRNSTQDLHLS